MAGINTNTNEIFEADFDFSKPKTAFVFKTMIDPFIGKYSLIKVRSGVIKPGQLFTDNIPMPLVIRGDCLFLERNA